MHSTTARIQNVFGFFTTVAAFVAAVTALSVILYPGYPEASVDVRNVKVMTGRPNPYSARTQEYAFVNFNLDADLSSLFNWNTKQVFTYLSVVYPGAKGTKHSDNEAVIWDAILTSPKTSKLHLNNERSKYNINDISGKFLERNATLRFSWNVQPHVGALVWGTIEGSGAGIEVGEKGEKWVFDFPKVAAKKTAKKN